MKQYDPKTIEPKWQKIWEETGIYKTTEDKTKPKKYVLEYFPYPSGAAMHVGHVRNYTIGDTIARFARMNGFNVLHPMGWDAFGLPAENYAIKNHVSPRQAIDENTKRFKQQLIRMGFGYDWSRELDSTDPDYYKWTQWFFSLLFKKGLAYQEDSLQWWCPVDKTVLANEQVESGKCWRCGNVVEKKALKQWFFKITDYADRLLDDLEDLDWSESIKSMQRNWIGKSTGAEIDFKVENQEEVIKVFTTRPDTLFGATFIILAPENPLVTKITQNKQRADVAEYVKKTQAKSDIDRQETDREKTGVFTGSHAINPVNREKIPIWVADYVLMGYGTGAIMAVPAHDERDFEFAQKHNLPIKRVVNGGKLPYQGEGKVVNSGKYNGVESSGTREKIVADLQKSGAGIEKVNYKIRDWLISRQRYWGAPIPIIHCPKDGAVAVPDNQLPVVFPEIKSYEPSGDGRSPLAKVPEFVNTTCPKCGGKAERETDTMDGFACSSWYFLRFADPHNTKEAFSKEKAKLWLPVDDYIGGAEHAVMHLLYARFWVKVMYDEGMVEFGEPFKKLRNQGMILAPDGQKMSKSKNNTIEPDGLIDEGYGSDSLRIMELFIGPWDQSASWSITGMGGSFRFLNRVWSLVREYLREENRQTESENTAELETSLISRTNKITKKVTQDLQNLGFNTAIAALMELTNSFYKIKPDLPFGASPKIWKENLEILVKLLAPFAPHITEELWHELGHRESVHIQSWPEWDEGYIKEDIVTLIVQVNGKLRANIAMPVDTNEDEMIQTARDDKKVKLFLENKEVIRTVAISGKLVNFVVK